MATAGYSVTYSKYVRKASLKISERLLFPIRPVLLPARVVEKTLPSEILVVGIVASSCLRWPLFVQVAYSDISSQNDNAQVARRCWHFHPIDEVLSSLAGLLPDSSQDFGSWYKGLKTHNLLQNGKSDDCIFPQIAEE